MRYRRLVEALLFVKWWRTLLAAALAAAMAAYIFWVENPRIESEQAALQLAVFDPERVDRIELRYPRDPTLVVEREGARWQLREPLVAAADEATVRLLIDAIRNVEVERGIPIADAEGLEIYGLAGEGTRAHVALRLDDGTDLPAIIVGDTAPVGYQTFVRVEGRDELLVTPLLFHGGVKKTAFDLRSKTIFAIDPGEIDEFSIESPAGRYSLQRKEGKWWLRAPIAARADDKTVSGILASLPAVTALAYFDQDDPDRAKFGIDETALQIQLQLSGGRNEGLRIGQPTEDPPAGFYSERRSDGQLFKGPDWLIARYGVDLSTLKDKHLFSCALDEVQRIEIAREDGRNFVLQRNGDSGWTAPSHPDAALNARRVERTAKGLLDLAGESFVAGATSASHGLDTPTVTATVSGRGGKECGTAVATRAPGDAGFYVANAETDTVMSIPEYLYSRLDVLVDDLVSEP